MKEDYLQRKREKFLEKLENCGEKNKKLEELFGSGITRKFLRLVYYPSIYFPYIFWKIGLVRTIKRRLFWGKEIFCKAEKENRDLDFRFLGYYSGDREVRLTKFFIKILKKNDIFYNIGAYYGFYTYLALEFCHEVHVFEPLPDAFKSLKSNLEKVPNVFLNNVGVSNTQGETFLFKNNVASTILVEVASFNKTLKKRKIKIKTITLDNYINSYSKPTVIKLDIEGAEKLAIKGSKKFLKENSPIIIIEVWGKEYRGEISMEAIRILRELGYQPHFIHSNGDLIRVESALSLNTFLRKIQIDNLVFTK